MKRLLVLVIVLFVINNTYSQQCYRYHPRPTYRVHRPQYRPIVQYERVFVGYRPAYGWGRDLLNNLVWAIVGQEPIYVWRPVYNYGY